jgi:transposase
VILDSQSVRAASGEDRGFDGYKQVRGRKRQILVDTQGLLHGVHIHAASISDTKAGAKIFEACSQPLLKNLKVVNADMGYRGTFAEQCKLRLNFYPWIAVRENTGQGKKKKAEEKKNKNKFRPRFTPPKRWIVERTFAWFNGYRRLARDYEKTTRSSAAMIYLGMTQLMLRRVYAAKS